MQEQKIETKVVRAVMRYQVTMEYAEHLMVPADATDQEIQTLVQQRYEDVDGGLYTIAPDSGKLLGVAHEMVPPELRVYVHQHAVRDPVAPAGWQIMQPLEGAQAVDAV